MRSVVTRDKGQIERFLRGDPYLHLYEIGDLDDPYFEHTAWHVLKDADEIRALALLYTGTAMPVVLSFATGAVDAARELLRQIRGTLPGRFYAHLSPGAVDVFSESHRIESHGTFLKMALTEPEPPDGVGAAGVAVLSAGDVDELKALYDASYRGHWFEPGMLAAGHYYGFREGGELVSAAGVHVFSPRYRVAALGNVATHPRARGKGLARRVTAKLCAVLHGEVDQIGLNVKDDNAGAIACYEHLGFRRCAVYGEYTLEGR